MAYTVKSGDNLSSIASKYGTTWQDIYNYNKDLIDSTAKARGVSSNFYNYIYPNQQLNIPGVDNVNANATAPVANTNVPTTQTTQQVAQTAPVTQNVQQVTQATPTKTTQELANEYATAQTASTSNDINALLAQYEKIAEQQKKALENQKLQTQNQINSQRQTVLDAYNNNARQAYINSMLAKQNVGQELSQAGLNTSGLVGSAYANVESAYGNNLANLQANRDNSIREIDTQLTNADLEYAIQESQLASEVENAKLELQKYGNELAYNRYQNALQNYMNFTNFDYSKKRDTVADNQWQKQYDLSLRQLEEDLKQYEQNLAYTRERDAVSDEQWQKNYELALKQLAKSSSSSRSSMSLEDYLNSLGGGEDETPENTNTVTNTTTNKQATLSEHGNNLASELSRGMQTLRNAGKSEQSINDITASYINREFHDGRITEDDVQLLVEKLGLK